MLLGIAIVIILILTICDQLLKSWVASSIVLGGSKQLIPGIIELTNLRNSGAAWSIFEGQQTFFYHYNYCCDYCNWLLYLAVP